MGIQFIGNESEMLVIGLIVSGIILCFCLVQAEKKASDPVMPLHIFKDRLLVLDFALFAVIWGFDCVQHVHSAVGTGAAWNERFDGRSDADSGLGL